LFFSFPPPPPPFPFFSSSFSPPRAIGSFCLYHYTYNPPRLSKAALAQRLIHRKISGPLASHVRRGASRNVRKPPRYGPIIPAALNSETKRPASLSKRELLVFPAPAPRLGVKINKPTPPSAKPAGIPVIRHAKTSKFPDKSAWVIPRPNAKPLLQRPKWLQRSWELRKPLRSLFPSFLRHPHPIVCPEACYPAALGFFSNRVFIIYNYTRRQAFQP